MATEIIRDTVAVLDASKVAELYSDMLDKQQAQFSIFLVVIGIVVTLVMGATWIWNHKFSKRQITKEIHAGFDQLKISTKDVIDALVKETMDDLSASMKKDLDSYKDDISEDLRKMKANICRVFALHCYSDDSFFNSATWWIAAFETYVELNDGRFEQISINEFVDALESCLKKEDISDLEKEDFEKMDNKIKMIPSVFTDQRDKARKTYKQIVEKWKKSSTEK